MPAVKMEGFEHVMNDFDSEIALKLLYCCIIWFDYFVDQ